GGVDRGDVPAAVLGDPDLPTRGLLAAGRPGVTGQQLGDLLDRVGFIGVVIGRIDVDAGVIVAAPGAVEEGAPLVDAGLVLAGDHRVAHVLEQGVLDEQLGRAPGAHPVGRVPGVPDVVGVGDGDVVDAAVALMRVGDSVVVQGQAGDQVVGPPHPEGLVVTPDG